MRFDQLPLWSDGQFLQPHHFQYFQRQNLAYLGTGRLFSCPYPWGLIDFEVDDDALAAGRVVVRRFSAILPDGTALSMPGNCLLGPLDLSEALKQNPNEITVYISLPNWSELEANLAEEGDGPLPAKRRVVPHQKRVRDENSGDNEITLITRRLNGRLTTDLDDHKDTQILPALKLTVLSHDKTERALAANEKFFPPYIILGQDSPLFGLLQGLIVDIRRARDKALDILTIGNFKNENLSGYNAYTVLRLKTLNVYEQRLLSLLSTGNVSPFDIYLELVSLLSELMAWDPVNSIREIRRYDHEDSAPQFLEIIKDIRSFILHEGSADYIRLDFKAAPDGPYLLCPVKPEDLFRAESAFLALKCSGGKDAAIKAVEEGDTFKLTNPLSRQLRIRGVKMTEEPYPPRFLPVLADTIWFKLHPEESARVWREITGERGMAVDYVADLFPAIELTLFLTLGGSL